MFKTSLIQTIAPIAGTVISALSSWALLEFRKYIATKTKNEQVNAAMTRITETTKTVVDNITQTLAGNLKSAAENGKLTGRQMADLKLQAYNTVIEQVPMAVRLIAMDAVESVPKMIQAKIEQAVLRSK